MGGTFGPMNKRWVRHLLFWAAYLLFETYLEFAWVSQEYGQMSIWVRWSMAFLSETAQLLCIKLPLVYALFHLLAAYNTDRANRWVLSVSAVLLLVFFLVIDRFLIAKLLFPYVYQKPASVPLFELQRLISTLLDLLFVAGIAIAAKQYSISQGVRERERLLIKEKLETELNFLKSQINPHFLFNTLNNIYSLARKKSDDTADVVVKLSKLLRFVLYESQRGTITIGREIQFLNDYIELEKIRYDDRLDLRFVHTATNLDAHIMPLMLVPLVENAFKHGASETTQKAFIHIELRQEGQELIFEVENSFEQENAIEIRDGIGLKNLRRRLELLYPRFELQMQSEGNRFKARLLLNLHHDN
ncbi:MAG: histidine kinase [Saprospiraceae bacterium]|nr:histidine kinase [Saprospiraceae bacterium]